HGRAGGWSTTVPVRGTATRWRGNGDSMSYPCPVTVRIISVTGTSVGAEGAGPVRLGVRQREHGQRTLPRPAGRVAKRGAVPPPGPARRPRRARHLHRARVAVPTRRAAAR